MRARPPRAAEQSGRPPGAGRRRSGGEAIRVAAGVLRRADGAVLIALRPRAAHQGGLWEFPGGKIERGEPVAAALARELAEELGVAIERAVPLLVVRHRYADKAVELNVLEVDAWRGEPRGREGQSIRWVPVDALRRHAFPAANLPVLEALARPRLALVTAALGTDERAYLERLERCLEAGVSLVQFRPCVEERQRFERVGRAAAALCARHGALMMVNGRAADVRVLGAGGLHLTSAALRRARRRPIGERYRLSASCHDAAELRQAERIGVDFAFVAPVRHTASHPDAAVLGWAGLRRLAAQARMPVYALGGMSAPDARAARRAGCQGVAMLSGLWDASAPERVVSGVEAAVEAAAYDVPGAG